MWGKILNWEVFSGFGKNKVIGDLGNSSFSGVVWEEYKSAGGVRNKLEENKGRENSSYWCEGSKRRHWVEGTTSVGQALCTDVWVVKNSDYVPGNCQCELGLMCAYILFTRHRLVPVLHLEGYLNYNSMLTQHPDSHLMESFSQVFMQSAVLGVQLFLGKHPHGAAKDCVY